MAGRERVANDSSGIRWAGVRWTPPPRLGRLRRLGDAVADSFLVRRLGTAPIGIPVQLAPAVEALLDWQQMTEAPCVR